MACGCARSCGLSKLVAAEAGCFVGDLAHVLAVDIALLAFDGDLRATLEDATDDVGVVCVKVHRDPVARSNRERDPCLADLDSTSADREDIHATDLPDEFVGVAGAESLGHFGLLGRGHGHSIHDHTKNARVLFYRSGDSCGTVEKARFVLYFCPMETTAPITICGEIDPKAVEQLERCVQHNHHNYAWQEEHYGQKVWVVRKGATPAFPGQKGFVGATMGEPSVILEGSSPESRSGENSFQENLLFSTVHGAGRVMSRTQAAGKVKRKKYWECRGHCREIFQSPPKRQETCDVCKGPIKKQFHVEKVREGEIDWKAATRDLRRQNIELRGGAADEAPGAYKRLDAVLGYHEGTVNILHELQPIGVAMAGGDINDPYKD